MDYKHTKKLGARTYLKRIIFIFLTVQILVLCYSMLSEPRFKKAGVVQQSVETKAIHSYGTILYSDIPPPPPSSGVDIIAWVIKVSTVITALGILSVFAKDIARLVSWLLWKLKYGKSRTPIILPTQK